MKSHFALQSQETFIQSTCKQAIICELLQFFEEEGIQCTACGEHSAVAR